MNKKSLKLCILILAPFFLALIPFFSTSCRYSIPWVQIGGDSGKWKKNTSYTYTINYGELYKQCVNVNCIKIGFYDYDVLTNERTTQNDIWKQYFDLDDFYNTNQNIKINNKMYLKSSNIDVDENFNFCIVFYFSLHNKVIGGSDFNPSNPFVFSSDNWINCAVNNECKPTDYLSDEELMQPDSFNTIDILNNNYVSDDILLVDTINKRIKADFVDTAFSFIQLSSDMIEYDGSAFAKSLFDKIEDDWSVSIKAFYDQNTGEFKKLKIIAEFTIKFKYLLKPIKVDVNIETYGVYKIAGCFNNVFCFSDKDYYSDVSGNYWILEPTSLLNSDNTPVYYEIDVDSTNTSIINSARRKNFESGTFLYCDVDNCGLCFNSYYTKKQQQISTVKINELRYDHNNNTIPTIIKPADNNFDPNINHDKEYMDYTNRDYFEQELCWYFNNYRNDNDEVKPEQPYQAYFDNKYFIKANDGTSDWFFTTELGEQIPQWKLFSKTGGFKFNLNNTKYTSFNGNPYLFRALLPIYSINDTPIKCPTWYDNNCFNAYPFNFCFVPRLSGW